MTEGRKMTARITCSEETRDILRGLADGAGVNYDELLQWLIKGVDDGLENRIDAMKKGMELAGTIPTATKNENEEGES
ncbi:MAG: hypothetical protein AAF126_01940 [Chloroflexota bacterium]